jgi:hypothetical protein
MFPRATAAMVSHKEKLEPDPSNQFGSAYASKGHRDHGSSGETSVEDSVFEIIFKNNPVYRGDFLIP